MVKKVIVECDPDEILMKTFLNNFQEVEKKYRVIRLYQKKNQKTILLLQPRLEEWILFQCAQSKVDPEKHGLPSRPAALKRVINLRPVQFKELCDMLSEKNNAGLQYLKRIVLECYN